MAHGGGRRILPLEPEALLAVLQGHGVEFVVIGGFSLAAHGYVRGTEDVDVVPQPGPANLERLAQALDDLDAEVELVDLTPSEVPVPLDRDGLAAGGNWCLRTRFGRLDVMQDVPGMRDYEQLRAGAVTSDVPGLEHPLPFAGYEHLVAMKSASGRQQDLIDIAELRRARGDAP